jgi:sodium-independent sulfate anion transporter 11
MSLLVGQTITRVISEHPEVSAPDIAIALSLFTGIIAMFIGLVRLGILVDFIPGNNYSKNTL